MAEGVLGLGTGASSLNQDLIDKLKESEREARVQPIENSIEDIEGEGGEAEKIQEIITKSNELLEAIKSFDLYVTTGVTAFDLKTASTSGESVVFDAADESTLNAGTTNVTISTLAKRDVFQSTAVDQATTEADLDAGDLNIAVAGSDGSYSTSYTFDTTGKTYEELVDEINTKSELTASVEEVGVDSYRLVIRSAESGLENELQITGAASQTLGYTTDGTTENAGSNTQAASNLTASVNGIDYDVSTNTIVVDNGLKITAVEPGDSSITISTDPSAIEPLLEEFVKVYNEFGALIDDQLFSADSKIEDKSTIRGVLDSIKSFVFGSYGTDDDLNVFNFGFEVDRYGNLSIDSTKLSEAVENDFEDLKTLFLGVAEDEGLGTQLKTYLEDLDSFDGLLTAYTENMDNRKDSLEEERDKAIEDLDSRYALMAQQFADYGTIINQFEAQFSGLKLMIEQSTA